MALLLTAETHDVERIPPMSDTEIDELMKAYAHDAVVAAGRREVTLDYSEQSLDAVDELLGRESFIGRTPRAPESPQDEEDLWAASKMFGAYVGEVAVRVFGGRWVGEPTADGALTPAIEVEGVKGFPVGKVWKRLTVSRFDSLGGYCRALRAILERRKAEVPEGPSDEAP